MAINRIAYFAQTGTLKMATGATARTYFLPINSASIEVTRPIEAVTAFGQFGALNQAQTNITTCKCSLKGYLGTGSGVIVTGVIGSGYQNFGVNADVLTDIVNTTRTGFMVVSVGPQGFSMTGICSNIGLDIAVGGFGMFDMGFAGIGNPYVSDAGSAATSAPYSALSLLPITTLSVAPSSGALSGQNATSIKFSYDMPTDTLTSLGENPNATQGFLNSIIATKAPYKASLSVEGFGINPNVSDDAIAASGVFLGDIKISLPTSKVTSRSMNNAAGQATATFSYTAEDVSATFTAVTLTGYTQTGTALENTPMWGAGW
jgi:hypothetical protein